MLSWPAFLEQAPEHTEVHTNERTSFLQIRTWIRILSLFLFEWIWNWGLGSRSWCKFYLNFFGSWYFLLPFQYLEHSMLTVFSCRVGFFFFFFPIAGIQGESVWPLSFKTFLWSSRQGLQSWEKKRLSEFQEPMSFEFQKTKIPC